MERGLFDGLGWSGRGWGRPIYTKREWLPVAAAIAADANECVGKRGAVGRSRIADLAIQVGPKATTHVGGTKAPAHYSEREREVVIDSEVALPGVDPATVNWSSAAWRKRHMRAVGLVEHEVGHAAHTPRGAGERWAREGEAVCRFGMAIEETRMEAQTVAGGGDQAALTAVANELILREWHPLGDRFSDAVNCAMILGRSRKHGGAMDDRELEDYREAYNDILGAETVERIEAWIGAYNRTLDRDVPDGPGMQRRMDDFSALVDAEPQESPGDGGEGEGEGEPSEGAGKGAGKGEAVKQMLIDQADDKAAAEAAAAAAAEGKEADSDKEATDEISHGYSGGSSYGATYEIPVDGAARKLASDLSREFSRIALPDVRKVPKSRVLPPGKLRGRGALARSAQSAAGMVPIAEPFRHVQKTSLRVPPPVVGIMADVSGSMRVSEVPTATLAWALAEAGRAVQARTGFVTFGNHGHTVKHQPTVITATEADGGWENFREGFKLLDSRLHLSAPGTGARVLFIITDGGFVGEGEAVAAERVTRHLERLGVIVVWTDFGHWTEGYGCGKTGRRVTCDAGDPAQTARQLAGAVTGAMRRAMGGAA